MPTKRPDDALTTFRRYGLAVVIVPALFVAVIVWLLQTNMIVHNLGDVFAAGVRSIIAETYFPGPLSVGDAAAVTRLDNAVRNRIERGQLTALRLRDTDGRVLYSTVTSEIGVYIPFDAAGIAALEDKTSTFRSATTPDGAGSSLKIVSPIHVSDDPDVVGVAEAYKPYASVAPSVRAANLVLIAVILAGAAVTYVILWALMRAADREIAHGRDLVDEMDQRLERSMTELEEHYLGTLKALNSAVDAKDSYTARHSVKVADYATALGRRLGMEADITTLERAGLLHDIGKIGISEEILQKPSGLTSEELQLVREHSRIGASIVSAMPFLADTTEVILYHHERWDGQGYPEGSAGEAIPRVARVLAVADSFDAMTSTRPYRPAMKTNVARRELLECSGKQFDPEIVAAMVALIDEGEVRTAAEEA